MKRRNRIISVLMAGCMAASVFSFAPGVFAQSQASVQKVQTENESAEKATAAETSESLEAEENKTADSKTLDVQAESQDLQAKSQEVNGTAQCQIQTSVEPKEGGTVSVDKELANEGETVAYTIEPAEGYKIMSIKAGEEEQQIEDPYTRISGQFTVKADTVLTVVFEKLKTYKITTSVNYKTRGTITAACSVEENGTKTITAEAKEGYYLSDLKVDGKSVGEKYSYSFKNIDKDHEVKAYFQKEIKVMLDAGHYANYNRSPVYPSYYESQMTWKLHNYLKNELNEYNGFYVGATRSSQGKDLSVYSRGTASKGYDLFLSLHSNSSSSKTSDYPLIITQKGNTGDVLAKELGQTIEDTMKTKQGYKIWQKLNSDGKTEYYGVLRGSKAVGTKGMIIEHSFHTNLAATKWLSSNSNLKKMAENEAAVLADYYDFSKKDATAGDDSNSSDGTTDDENVEEPVIKEVVSSSEKVKVTADNLKIRESYSTKSKSVGKTEKGDVYQLKAKTKDGKWGQLESGYWIYLPGYTEVVLPVKKTVTTSQKVQVTVNSLNMRQSYSTASKSMGKVKKDAVYQLKAKTEDGEWGQLKTNGYWIYLPGYTKVVTDTSSQPASKKTVKSSQKVKVTVSSLNMRKSYSTGAKSMGKARKNKTYQLKAKTKDGKWGQLKVNSYWIYLPGYTKAVTDKKTTGKTVKTSQRVKVTVSSLNMRKSYSTGAKSMGKVQKNKTYQLKAKTKDGKWGQLKVNGYWIYLPGYTKKVS